MNSKSQLNEVCQKYKVPFPEYETEAQGSLWVSTCTIYDGNEFVSLACDTKKGAEMESALLAVRYLRLRQPPTLDELERLARLFEERKFLQNQKRELREFEKNPISRLNEIYQRRGPIVPDFVFISAPGPNHKFLCEITLIYHGNKKFRSTPHTNKSTSKHEVATLAVEYINDLERKDKAKQAVSDLVEVPPEGPQPLGAISELNEYCQKLGLPSPVYDFDYSINGHWKSRVTLFDGKTFESGVHPDKKTGKYEVAQVALQYVDSLGTFGYKPPPVVIPPFGTSEQPTSSSPLTPPSSVVKVPRDGKVPVADGHEDPSQMSAMRVVSSPTHANPIGALVDMCQKNGRRIPVFDFEYSAQSSSWRCICTIYDGAIFKSGWYADKKSGKVDVSEQASRILSKRWINLDDVEVYTSLDQFGFPLIRNERDIDEWVDRYIYRLDPVTGRFEGEPQSVFFDSEWPPVSSPDEPMVVSWLGLAVPFSCIVVPSRLFRSRQLMRMMRDRRVVKIGHGIENDKRALARSFALNQDSLDAFTEFTSLLPEEGWNGRLTPLSVLSRHFLGRRLDKERFHSIMHDWSTETLTEHDFEYFANEVCVLCEIYFAIYSQNAY